VATVVSESSSLSPPSEMSIGHDSLPPGNPLFLGVLALGLAIALALGPGFAVALGLGALEDVARSMVFLERCRTSVYQA